MQYRIVLIDGGITPTSSKQKLEQEVSDLIEQGWKPSGGVSIAYHRGYDDMFFAQAMIKED